MRTRALLAAAAAVAAIATPAAASGDATYVETAEHFAVTGVTTSVVPPTVSLSIATRPVTVSQAVAKGMPSAYGTVTAAFSCSVAAIGDVTLITITECSVTSNTGDSDNNPAGGFVNAATTAGNTNLTGRTIRVCVNAYVTPRVGSAFYSGRACGISI